jgi:hypothetical protein
MESGLNYLGQFGFSMSFENGWTININKLPCGHNSITIIPRHVFENNTLIVNEPYFYDAMTKRGDYIAHWKGDDDELLDRIVEVACHKPEPGFAAIGQAIWKAVKS